MGRKQQTVCLYVVTGFELAGLLQRKEKSVLMLGIEQAVNGKYSICICAFVSTYGDTRIQVV